MPGTPERAPAPPARSLLRANHGFRNLWCANLVSVFGDGLYFVALPWIVYQHTHSGLATALTFVAGTIPYLLVGPFAGVYVDRWDRRLTLVSADLLRAATLMIGWAILLADYNTATVIAVAFLLPAFSRFFVPAQRATTPLLVDGEELVTANALMEGAGNAGWIAGPALGGLLIIAIGGLPLLLLDELTFLASAAFLSRLSFPATERLPARSVGSEMLEGLRLVWRSPSLRVLCLLAPLANGGFGAVIVSLPIWTARSAHAGATAFGVLSAAVFVGAFAGSLVLVRKGKQLSRVKLVIGGLAGMGLGTVGYGLAHNVLLGALLLMVVGAALSAYNIGILTMLQINSAPAQRGRVFSLNEICAYSLRPIVSLAIGALADAWSINGIVALMGFALVIVALLMVGNRALRAAAHPLAARPLGAAA